jgi:hypothetical protein
VGAPFLALPLREKWDLLVSERFDLTSPYPDCRAGIPQNRALGDPMASPPTSLYDFPRHPQDVRDPEMKILGIIAMSFLAIITSLLFLLSSTCVVAIRAQPVLGILGAIFAVLFLTATVALVKQIVKTSREP